MKKQLLIFCFSLLTTLFLHAQNTFPTTGNVGIGTISPIYELGIHDNAPGTDSRIHLTNADTGTAWTDGLQIIQNGDTNAKKANFLLREDAKMGFWTNNLERITISNNGNVGIGTTAPYSKLQIEGRASVGTWGVLNVDWTYDTNWGGHSNKWAGYIGFNAYRNNDDAKDNYYGRNIYTNKGVFEGSNYGFRWLYRNRINNDSNLQNQLTEYMRLDNNGNLGIGTTNTKGFKLGVKGKIAAEEVKVTTYANWVDFVFENNYHLPTLKEVEQHIKEKGHLKDIPSAEEVKKDGFFLGEMDSKLLQKIEELTLYTIEQEKKIKKLEKENKVLQLLSIRLAEIEKLLSNKNN